MNDVDIKCVKAGIKLLNEVKPNWRDFIDSKRLDLADGRRCVAAQVFYDEADKSLEGDGYAYLILHVLPVSAYDCDYGFYLHPEGSSWEGLREAWIELAGLAGL